MLCLNSFVWTISYDMNSNFLLISPATKLVTELEMIHRLPYIATVHTAHILCLCKHHLCDQSYWIMISHVAVMKCHKKCPTYVQLVNEAIVAAVAYKSICLWIAWKESSQVVTLTDYWTCLFTMFCFHFWFISGTFVG